jgi:hypothetical protein
MLRVVLPTVRFFSPTRRISLLLAGRAGKGGRCLLTASNGRLVSTDLATIRE